MKYTYVFFDLDGTLTDPKEGITKSVAYALKHFGIEVDPNELTHFIGPPLTGSFEAYYGFSHEQAIQAVKFYRERFGTIGLFENKVYPGIEALLKLLKAQSRKLAVATSKPYVFSIRILEKYGLAQYFDWVVGSELDGTRDKKCEVIEEVLGQAGITKQELSQCLMVGDRKHDIEGAKLCQITSLGVQYGYSEAGELEKAGADIIVQNIEELQAFFLSHES